MHGYCHPERSSCHAECGSCQAALRLTATAPAQDDSVHATNENFSFSIFSAYLPVAAKLFNLARL